ncbi:MAG: hypothetical protein DRP96_02175 [Candidatus Neomarinimicrobiota bacterium]|nr:MAG: hypothetical protein DRP96_02175 [Candidatus Neomarinimicrobiota bacterium]
MRIVLIDSGFGGMNIASGLYETIKDRTDAEIIFVNGLPHEKYGYNSINKTQDKVNILNDLLLNVDGKLAPDLIVIACNTLSVLLNKTNIIKNIRHKIVDIIQFGTHYVYEQYKSDSDCLLAVMGSNTTIESDVHRRYFLKYSHIFKDIITVSATELIGSVEKNVSGKKTNELIRKYIKTVGNYLSPNKERFTKIILILACTHFPYATNIFKKALEKLHFPYDIVNPNGFMTDYLSKKILEKENYNRGNVSFRIISKTVIEKDMQDSIGRLIEKTSPELKRALRNYEYAPDLFSPEKYIS